MFSKILIANRGEIAVRIIKTARRLGVTSAVVYSEADAGSLAVAMADEAYPIGPPPPGESYLVMEKILDAARKSGAEAIHPGFGFLSEKAEFARAVAEAGLVFIGPNPHAIDAMGDKIASKEAAAAAGVSTVPGHMDIIKDADQAVKIAKKIGFPVMLKASAGGGGKGMRIAYDAEEAREGFTSASNEARTAFGDDRVFIEKFIEQPRHIEIQVLGDKHGNVVHLGERECSIQRRNQKVIEEAPSPFLTETVREAMGAQAIALAKAVDYDSAGTVEFIVDKDRNFYFLEMNTRLQVEHPVTEMITRLDLVEQMLRAAAGERLSITQDDVRLNGWAVECRLYAEDPYRGFAPSIGRLTRLRPPAETSQEGRSIRLDTGVVEGDVISMFYDPMIAKLVTHGPDRLAAIDTALEALDVYELEGIQDNRPFLSAVLETERFREGALSTAFIAETFPEGFGGTDLRADQKDKLIAAAAFAHVFGVRRAGGISGRIATPKGAERDVWCVLLHDETHEIATAFGEDGGELTWAASGRTASLETTWRPGERLFKGELDGERFAVFIAPAREGYQLRHRGAAAHVIVTPPRAAELHERLPEKEPADTSGLVVSPMPGLVVSLSAAVGQSVKAGEALVVVEAMKMENVIRAGRDGVVKATPVEPGESVAADQVLVELE